MNQKLPNLPAGLIDDNIEFFVCKNLHAYCIKNGKVVTFEDFDTHTVLSLEKALWQHPGKVAALMEMGFLDTASMIKKFLQCNYGGFDSNPDMIDGRLQEPEYVPCSQRGLCAQEGRLCNNLKTETGDYLSRREVQVVSLTAAGLLNKQIAQELGISENTLPTHYKNIQRKTGLQRKVDISGFAYRKNLIAL